MISNERYSQEIISLLCFRFSKYNLLAIKDFLGNERFMQFLEQFAGAYVKVPSNKKLWEAIDDLKLYALHTKKKEAYRARRLSEWEALEVKFVAECKRRKITERHGERIAREVANELREALAWLSEVDKVEKSQRAVYSPIEMDNPPQSLPASNSHVHQKRGGQEEHKG